MDICIGKEGCQWNVFGEQDNKCNRNMRFILPDHMVYSFFYYYCDVDGVGGVAVEKLFLYSRYLVLQFTKNYEVMTLS